MEAGYNSTNGSYQIKAVTPTKRYNQAFINYGPHSNVKLMVEYGFTLDKNLNNMYPVYLGKKTL